MGNGAQQWQWGDPQGDGPSSPVDPPAMTPTGQLAQAAGKVVGGVVKTVGSLFGGGARRREQRRAKKEMAMRKSDFEDLDTSNPYKNITNPYQNLTVSTQAADFAAQQTAQGSANIMHNLAAAAGGGGVAALAQSLANSQAMASQQASADLAKQEQRNAMLGAQGESQRQLAVAAGETQSQKMEYEKQGTLLGMSQQRLGAANLARKEATAATIGGITDIGAGVAEAAVLGAGAADAKGTKDGNFGIMGGLQNLLGG